MDYGLDFDELYNWSWVVLFFLFRVSHKGEFYLDMFLIRQPLH